MHATSLQGFDYGDVVHQFEKRCKCTKNQYHGRTIYEEKETGYLWYVDNLHSGKSAHLEVFDNTGKNHIGESDLEGKIDRTKSHKKKSI